MSLATPPSGFWAEFDVVETYKRYVNSGFHPAEAHAMIRVVYGRFMAEKLVSLLWNANKCEGENQC